jgi:hypothetical protein
MMTVFVLGLLLSTSYSEPIANRHGFLMSTSTDYTPIKIHHQLT